MMELEDVAEIVSLSQKQYNTRKAALHMIFATEVPRKLLKVPASQKF